MKEFLNQVVEMDCLLFAQSLPDSSVDCVITSPPYWGLRDYGVAGQFGNENTPQEFIANLVSLFTEIKRVLKPNGTVWLNIGDSYYNYRPGKGQALVKQTVSNSIQDLPQECARRANKLDGLKEKDLIGIPWRLAFALQDDGWYLRQDIIWQKNNPMPESVKDRCTKSHEYIFLLTKSPQYYFNNQAIREPQSEATIKDIKARKTLNNKGDHGGTRVDLARDRTEYVPDDGLRNKRSVWTVNTKPYAGAHFAVFPKELILPCVLAGCPEGGVVYDPFMGSGTTALVALENSRNFIGSELNPKYIELAMERLKSYQPNLF